MPALALQSVAIMTAPDIDDLLADIRLADEDRYQIVQSLRRLVASVSPDITEELNYGGLLYSAGSPFCGVFAYARHVSLEFSRGADLADPHAVLEGQGKKRRHIKIVQRGDIFKKNVREYVERAFAGVSRTDPTPARGRIRA
jgi:hypothetical protein